MEPTGTVVAATPQKELPTDKKPEYRDPSCFISTAELMTLQKDTSLVLIDVRDEPVFKRLHIPDSLNMPPFAIKSKTFLKAKHLVLLNEGHSYRRVGWLCHELREAGFSKVSILKGGLNAWRQYVGQLEGDALAERRLNRMTPAEFYQEKHALPWRIAKISGGKQGQKKVLATSMVIPRDAGSLAIRKAFQALVAEEDLASRPFILVASEHGENYEKVEHALRDSDLVHVFYLDGGMEAYRKHLKVQADMWHRIPGKQGRVRTCGASG